MEDSILQGGAMESDYEYDYRMGGVYERPQPLYTFSDKKIQYNQSKNDPRGCTRYGAMTCITNNWGIEWTKEDFDYMRATAPSYGWKPSQGMYTSKAGDMVVDYLNKKFPDQNRVKETYNHYEEDTELFDRIGEGWCAHMGSFINKDYTDKAKDGLIESPRVKNGIGHSRTWTKPSTYTGCMIVENYNGVLPYNVIELKDYIQFWRVKQRHNQSFIYYPTNKMPEITVPYMTVEQAEALEKKYPDQYTASFSESVRAWVDLVPTGKMKLHYKNYTGVDGVMKMMNDLLSYRS